MQVTKIYQDFDREVMDYLKIVDAGLDGSVAYELYMAPNFSNLNSMTQVDYHSPES